jgi:uncharacterized membrane protein YfcA
MEWTGLLVLGFAVGVYGTLIGAGGGFLLVPILLMAYPGKAPTTITAISMAMVLANAVSGAVAYARMGRIHYRAGIMFALATVPGAIIGAKVVDFIDPRTFAIIMALFLLAIAAFLILRPREESKLLVQGNGGGDALLPGVKPPPPDFPFNARLGVLLSLAVGFIASMLGVGGGIMHVPALVSLLRFPVHVATATSHFVLVFTALAAVLTHAFDLKLGTQDLIQFVAPLAIGVIPGAQLGAMLAKKVKGPWILRALGIALVLVAARLLMTKA